MEREKFNPQWVSSREGGDSRRSRGKHVLDAYGMVAIIVPVSSVTIYCANILSRLVRLGE